MINSVSVNINCVTKSFKIEGIKNIETYLFVCFRASSSQIKQLKTVFRLATLIYFLSQKESFYLLGLQGWRSVESTRALHVHHGKIRF
jgi:hypothetical protein